MAAARPRRGRRTPASRIPTFLFARRKIRTMAGGGSRAGRRWPRGGGASMRVLITGGAGYIGSHTAKAFAEAGHEGWAYDNLSAGHRAAAPAGRLIVGELEDAD